MSVLDEEATRMKRSRRLPPLGLWPRRIASLHGGDAHTILFGGILVLLSINIINDLLGRPYWPITRAIDVGREGNLATWFSSLLWLTAASMAFLSFRAAIEKHIEPSIGWLILCVLLFLVAIDEGAEIHEYLGSAIANYFATTHLEHEVSLFGFEWNDPYWFLILGPLALIGFIFSIFYFKSYFPPANASGKLVMGGVFLVLTGGVAVEAFNSTLLHDLSVNRVIRNIMVLLEEGLEMSGAWMVSYGLFLQKQHLLSR